MVQVNILPFEQRLNVLVGTRACINTVIALVRLVRSPGDHEFRTGD